MCIFANARKYLLVSGLPFFVNDVYERNLRVFKSRNFDTLTKDV